ncbi:hypothetical protein GOC53_25130 [Sinorhizobium medicae]|uniref:transposase n=1 Tax=Sinorhizobium medicae TaxID=110321 RepID=UPI0009DB4B03|nr:hypothetical protein [Sinorhizobium medicae]MDX0475817.1 hypothetical protein [Sinorhizobium medicae]MDX0493543.1 hypothetical protein [Sinorhizobium medicae]MDX0599147.1 hypothetical protein [Sinorhizobium medicae]MDX0605471.1 hypothetical protein [Sinorhizobium medicae]
MEQCRTAALSGHVEACEIAACGADRQQVTRLATDEFIHRFLINVLPRAFHRIRH